MDPTIAYRLASCSRNNDICFSKWSVVFSPTHLFPQPFRLEVEPMLVSLHPQRAKSVTGRCESSDVIAARESVYNCLIARTLTPIVYVNASVPVAWLPWLLLMYSQLRSKRTTRITGHSTCGWGAARTWSRPRSEFAFLVTFSGRRLLSRGVRLNPSEHADF